MIWLIEIALVLLLIGGGWTMLTRKGRESRREALTMRRIALRAFFAATRACAAA